MFLIPNLRHFPIDPFDGAFVCDSDHIIRTGLQNIILLRISGWLEKEQVMNKRKHKRIPVLGESDRVTAIV
jgi:hypothetical protein